MSKPLKLNGLPLNLHPPSPTQEKVRKFLDKAPADELFSTAGLAKTLNIGVRSVTYVGAESDVDEYTHKHGAVRYWGNKSAIKALRQQLEAGA